MTSAVFAPPTLHIDPLCFTPELVEAYGALTSDMNPIHVDAAFAAQTRFGRPIVHGLFVLVPIWTAVAETFGPAAMSGARADVRFAAPTFVGTTPSYSLTLEASDAAVACYRIAVAAEDGTAAVSGKITIPRA